MKSQSVFQISATALAVCIAFLGLSAPATAQSTCSPTDAISLDGNVYIYQQNEWNSNLQQCASVNGVGFTLTTANFNDQGGAPATYPSVFRGCHWGNCTSSNPFPIQENNITSATTSVNITQPSGYNNDSAYDIWFNQTSTTSGQPDGTEVMIWINHQGFPSPFGSQTAIATIDGATWKVWTGRQSSWNIISYVREAPVTSVNNLNLVPFFNDAVSRGSLQSSWWLIDVEYGFEVWTGGQGLAANNFSVNATAGGGGSINTSAWYNIVNQNSGSCVDATNQGTANGTTVQQWACGNGQSNQEWQFQFQGNGVYSVVNRNAQSGTWNVTNNGTANGSLMQLWTYAGFPNEQWMPVSLGSGFYKFVGVGSGRCLDTPSASTANGVQLDIFDCNGTGAQSFELIAQP